MPNLLIRDVPQETIDRLKKQAQQHNRSLQGEVKNLIEETMKPTTEDALSRARKIRASFGRKRFSDSAELQRKDRGR